MNSNELMIGDFVKCRESTCQGHRVDYINEMDGEVGVDGEILDLDMVYPIPLTLEILEKNGFEIYEQDFTSNTVYKFGPLDYMEYEEYHKYFNIGCKIKYKRFVTEITYIHSLMRIQYVHELQHALKLCGIEKEIEL